MKRFYLLFLVLLLVCIDAKAEKKLYWANSWGTSIGVADLNGSNSNQNYVSMTNAAPGNFTYSYVNNKFYWIDEESTTSIGCSDSDGDRKSVV